MTAHPLSVSRRRDEALFWVTRQILRADSDAQRAAILLGLPDLVLSGRHAELADACEACHFADGAAFIAVRVAAWSALRDDEGRLPATTLAQVERARRRMVAIAATSGRDREIASWIEGAGRPSP